MTRWLLPLALFSLVAPSAQAARLKELVDIEGFRPNHLVGMGLVVGLAGTGDDASSVMTRQPLAQMLRHLGTVVNPNDLKMKNVAVVMVTADLPPFGKSGMSIDVTVSSANNAKSLVGGTLVETELKAVNGETYALAQGALMLGGFAADAGGATGAKKNHVNVGRIPSGAVIERDAPNGLPDGDLMLVLRQPDFTTAWRIASAINSALGGGARVRDPAAVRISAGPTWKGRTVELIALLEALDATPDAPARVIINERTGTIAIGANVSLTAVAIAHGGINIKVEEHPLVSQPNPLAGGQTTVVPEQKVDVEESGGQLAMVGPAPTVGDVAVALNQLGVKPRDLVAIFQALKSAGALHAELVVQ